MKKIYRFKVEKLVRDKTGERSAGFDAILESRVMQEEEYKKELKKKLLEEALEVQEANNIQELVSELSDVFDIYETLLTTYNISQEQIAQCRNKKLSERGSFSNKIYASHIDVYENPENPSWLINYFLSSPEKYPLIEIRYK